MRANKKRLYQNRRATHKFKVGDLFLLKKYNADKMDLKLGPNYRIVKLPSSWPEVLENQINGRTKRCKVGDFNLKHPSEDWELKPSPIGRAAKFVNHPDNLLDIDIKHDSKPALSYNS